MKYLIAIILPAIVLIATSAEVHATFPGENGKIACNGFIMNPDGSEITRVTGGFPRPRWAPDGTKIAIDGNWFSPDDRDYEKQIWVVNADLTGRTKINDRQRELASLSR